MATSATPKDVRRVVVSADDALRDLQAMFPALERDVIAAVIIANRGSVNKSVDSLIEIAGEIGDVSVDARHAAAVSASGHAIPGDLPAPPPKDYDGARASGSHSGGSASPVDARPSRRLLATVSSCGKLKTVANASSIQPPQARPRERSGSVNNRSPRKEPPTPNFRSASVRIRSRPRSMNTVEADLAAVPRRSCRFRTVIDNQTFQHPSPSNRLPARLPPQPAPPVNRSHSPDLAESSTPPIPKRLSSPNLSCPSAPSGEKPLPDLPTEPVPLKPPRNSHRQRTSATEKPAHDKKPEHQVAEGHYAVPPIRKGMSINELRSRNGKDPLNDFTLDLHNALCHSGKQKLPQLPSSSSDSRISASLADVPPAPIEKPFLLAEARPTVLSSSSLSSLPPRSQSPLSEQAPPRKPQRQGLPSNSDYFNGKLPGLPPKAARSAEAKGDNAAPVPMPRRRSSVQSHTQLQQASASAIPVPEYFEEPAPSSASEYRELADIFADVEKGMQC